MFSLKTLLQESPFLDLLCFAWRKFSQQCVLSHFGTVLSEPGTGNRHVTRVLPGAPERWMWAKQYLRIYFCWAVLTLGRCSRDLGSLWVCWTLPVASGVKLGVERSPPPALPGACERGRHRNPILFVMWMNFWTK